MAAQRMVAIDPGREKCGVAVLDAVSGEVFEQEIVPPSELHAWLEACRMRNETELAVIGHRTAQKEICALAGRLGYRIEIVDEDFSTEEARQRYWLAHPPTGWRRFCPRGLLLPPVPVDDYAAIILAERYLKTKKEKKAEKF